MIVFEYADFTEQKKAIKSAKVRQGDYDCSSLAMPHDKAVVTRIVLYGAAMAKIVTRKANSRCRRAGGCGGLGFFQ